MTDRSELVEQILRGAADPKDDGTKAWVKFKRPYTIGTVEHRAADGIDYVGLALAKVCWPDEWNPKKGANIVIIRAAREIADDMIEKQNGRRFAAHDAIDDVLEDILAENVGAGI